MSINFNKLNTHVLMVEGLTNTRDYLGTIGGSQYSGLHGAGITNGIYFHYGHYMTVSFTRGYTSYFAIKSDSAQTAYRVKRYIEEQLIKNNYFPYELKFSEAENVYKIIQSLNNLPKLSWNP